MGPTSYGKWSTIPTNYTHYWWALLFVAGCTRRAENRDFTILAWGSYWGHLGKDKTLHQLKEWFYWPGQYSDVQNYCQTCAICASRKSPTKSSKSPLGTISAAYPMAVDLVGPFPGSDSGKLYIMVVGDYFLMLDGSISHSKSGGTNSSREACRWSVSTAEQLHSDQGRLFESQFMMEIYKLLQINKTRTTLYHPQSDDLVERCNRTMLAMLATCAKDNPLDWEKHVGRCVWRIIPVCRPPQVHSLLPYVWSSGMYPSKCHVWLSK